MIVGRRQQQAGFTLIELMIVVVIVGVLMLLVLPAYQDNVRKTRRADGMQMLLEIASRQENFMLDRSTYTTNLAQLGYEGTSGVPPFFSRDEHYTMSVGDCGTDIATCFVITAAPRGGQIEDTRCGSFTLNSQGVRGSTGTLANEDCW